MIASRRRDAGAVNPKTSAWDTTSATDHGSADRTWKFHSFDCGDHCAASPRGCTDVEKKEIDEVVRSISQERDEQRTIEQIKNMTVPQIQEQIVRGVKVIPQEHSPERIVEQIVIIHVPHVLEEFVENFQIIPRRVASPRSSM